MLPLAFIPGYFSRELAHYLRSELRLHGWNKREECCHFGTSGRVFTLWVQYFRATNAVILSDGFHFLFWLRVMAYVPSARIHHSGFSSRTPHAPTRRPLSHILAERNHLQAENECSCILSLCHWHEMNNPAFNYVFGRAALAGRL